MTKISNIAAAFDALKPGLEREFVESVTRRVERLLAKYPGPKALRALAHQYGDEANSYRALRRYMAIASKDPVTREILEHSVDHALIAQSAKEYADYTVATFVIKLTKKLADLDEVEFAKSSSSTDFSIRGKLNGSEVQVAQRQILNWSSKGTPFHQFPALIYVDGKRISEAQFKRLPRG